MKKPARKRREAYTVDEIGAAWTAYIGIPAYRSKFLKGLFKVLRSARRKRKAGKGK